MKAYVLVVLFLLHVLQTESQSLPVNDPVHVPAKVLKSGANRTCPSQQDTIDAKDNLFRSTISTALSAVTAGCGGAGWRRVGYLDMTDPDQSCPPGLSLKTYSSEVRACGRAAIHAADCWSTFYTTGSQYSRVCGRVRGYQFGGPQAFIRGQEIDGYYADGMSLTHGQSGNRTHIWTFVVGISETVDQNYIELLCPCVSAGAEPPPPFVGADYFCESGLHDVFPGNRVLYPDDPLWDGQNCISNCCAFNNPPYFTKTLPAPTSDSIELRLCSSTLGKYSGSPIDQVELYVQ